MEKYKTISFILVVILTILLPVCILITIWFDLVIGLKLILSDATLLSFFLLTGKYVGQYLKYNIKQDEKAR